MEVYKMSSSNEDEKKFIMRTAWVEATLGDPIQLGYHIVNGFPVNFKDIADLSCLHYAAIAGHVDCIKLLLAAGAETDLPGGVFGRTAVHYAALLGNTEALVELAKDRVNAVVVDKDGKSPLHLAAEQGHYECVDVLLKAGNSPLTPDIYGRSSLVYAAEGNHYNCAFLMLTPGLKAIKHPATALTQLMAAVQTKPQCTIRYVCPNL